MRPASGTWGSLPVPVLAVGLVWLLGADGLTTTDHWILNGVLVVVGAFFSWACLRYGGDAEQRWGRSDPGQVVADEVAGQAIALLALPWAALADADGWRHTLLLALTGFLAFRICDIVKPPPANGLQRLPGGRGILVDDLIAGVYALAITQVVARLVL
ncbi:MAG: phosphatidylglycerophosphatase A [Planctomycetes bacterium]|nr:phosphatidylglycerophosphatase A [Planctomycetota bacterium]